ncbi:MAG: FAD-dependent monooxygenase [Chitinophagaceae bacterium]|nr:FAD-dependent monooxygenase [Chitinophagaceae bacterium]
MNDHTLVKTDIIADTIFTKKELYDVAIVGGGLAGLALAIQLARLNYTVILFEKEQYPFHKVCGEYISMESWPFLHSLGLNLKSMQLPMIKKLIVSSNQGKLLKHDLPLGGFGISRYLLDYELEKIALSDGVTIRENTKVNDVVFNETGFAINTSQQNFHAKIVCGSFGKRSNLDIKWKRDFISTSKNSLNNFVGVKYHIKTNFPADTIALHNFKNGYCGIVKIEDDKYNLCYLTNAVNLKKNDGQVNKMEENILSKNPHLEKIFRESEVLFASPLTISQISFDKKKQVEDHVLMIGDAAGMITPLCGNGMSMALLGSKLAAEQIHEFLKGNIERNVMEERYTEKWQKQFATRLKMGRTIQRMFNQSWLTNFLITSSKSFPGFIDYLVRQTHGKPF